MIRVTAASCFIPLWSDISGGYPKLDQVLLNKTHSYTHSSNNKNQNVSDRDKIRDLNEHGEVICIDGGISAFMPPIGDIRVSPFPPTFVLNQSRKPHIYLDIKNNSVDISNLPHLLWLSWKPSKEAVLRGLYQDGQQAAYRYLEGLDQDER